MKTINRIKLLSMIATVATATLAHADLGRDQLDQISKSEASWRQAKIQVSGFEGAFSGYLTDAGSLRVSEMPKQIRSAAVLSVSASPQTNTAQFQQWCGDMKYAFDAAKKDRNPYRLNVRLFPFAQDSQLSVDGHLSQAAIANAVSIIRTSVQLSLSAGANSIDTGLDKVAFQTQLAQQLNRQRDSLQSNGTAVLDLTGWDDVACDLIQGTAQLDFAIGMQFEAPLVSRRTVISPAQMQGLYGYVQEQGVSSNPGNTLKNLLLDAAVLGGAFASGAAPALAKSPVTFGLENFLGVFNQLFEISSGQSKVLNDSDVSRAATGLDSLSRGNDIRTPIVHPTVSLQTR